MIVTKLTHKNTEVIFNDRKFNIHKERYAGMNTFRLYLGYNRIYTAVTFAAAVDYIKNNF